MSLESSSAGIVRKSSLLISSTTSFKSGRCLSKLSFTLFNTAPVEMVFVLLSSITRFSRAVGTPVCFLELSACTNCVLSNSLLNLYTASQSFLLSTKAKPITPDAKPILGSKPVLSLNIYFAGGGFGNSLSRYSLTLEL
ncbi:MAG: hypothetical protein DDT40_01316 [candidate division WS2 bacterium]|nr:hypothetical protein [Candidatus Psychracetigena formicireducens]